MKNIALSIFQHTAKKYLKKNQRKRQFIDYNKAQNILLLYECITKQDNENIIQIINTLKNDNKKIEVVGFCKNKNCILPNSSIIQTIGKKDISFFKKPKALLLKNLTSKGYDIIINLSTEISLPLMHLVLYTNAPFKIGTQTLEPKIYDFILDMSKQYTQKKEDMNPSNIRFIFNQVFFYLKGIKSND